jgi:hypothetical protein
MQCEVLEMPSEVPTLAQATCRNKVRLFPQLAEEWEHRTSGHVGKAHTNEDHQRVRVQERCCAAALLLIGSVSYVFGIRL